MACALATAACGVLDTVQRELIFRPVTEEWKGYAPGMAGEERVWIPVAGDARLQGWWLASPGARHTIVFFHGARVNLSGSVYRLRAMRDAGYNVFAVDYRGYGESSALLPSEDSLYEDARAAWRWLDARVPDRGRRILYGHSLGGPVAAELALEGEAAALVLESSFTSVAELTRLGALVTQRMDLLAKLPRIDLPVVVVHGDQDDMVPPEMARRLYEAARGPKRLLMVDGAGHRWVAFRAGERLFGALRELTEPRGETGAPQAQP